MSSLLNYAADGFCLNKKWFSTHFWFSFYWFFVRYYWTFISFGSAKSTFRNDYCLANSLSHVWHRKFYRTRFLVWRFAYGANSKASNWWHQYSSCTSAPFGKSNISELFEVPLSSVVVHRVGAPATTGCMSIEHDDETTESQQIKCWHHLWKIGMRFSAHRLILSTAKHFDEIDIRSSNTVQKCSKLSKRM